MLRKKDRPSRRQIFISFGIINGQLDSQRKDLAYVRQDLFKELANPLIAFKVSANSKDIVEWVCPKKHIYEATTNSRFYGSGCGYCSNRKLYEVTPEQQYYSIHNINKKLDDRRNDLYFHRPDIAQYLVNPDLLFAMTPSGYFYDRKNNPSKILFKCKNNHNWETDLRNALKTNFSCKQCPKDSANEEKAIYEELKIKEIEEKTFNKSIVNTHPEVMEYWDYEKNTDANPKELTYGSNRRVYWKHGDHEWNRRIKDQVKRSECKVCTLQKQHGKAYKTFVENNGSIEEKFPELLKYWDYVKNEVAPSEVYYGTRREYWWSCSLNHLWKQKPEFLDKHNNCLYCHNRRLLKGFNDLKTNMENIEVEYSVNNKFKVDEVIYKPESNKKFLWNCSKCHGDYEASLSDYVSGFRKCSNCYAGGITSRGQFEVAKFIESLGYKIEENARIFQENFMELDIYLRELNIAIEYNGSYWHSIDSVRKKDVVKEQLCSNYGVKLLTIWEDDWLYNNGEVKKMLTQYFSNGSIDELLFKSNSSSETINLNGHKSKIKEKSKRSLSIDDCRIVEEDYMRGVSGNEIYKNYSLNKNLVFNYINGNNLPLKRLEIIGLDKYRRRVEYKVFMKDVYENYMNGKTIMELSHKYNYSIKYIELVVELLKK